MEPAVIGSVSWTKTTTYPSDDPIYRAGVLMGRNQMLTDVMERLFSPDAMSSEKTVRALHAWVRQTMDEVRVEMQIVFADLSEEDDEDA